MTIAQTLTKAQATGNDFLMFADDHGAYDPQPKAVSYTHLTLPTSASV